MNLAYIIGVEGTKKNKVYRMVRCTVNKTASGDLDWAFKFSRYPEETLVQALASGKGAGLGTLGNFKLGEDRRSLVGTGESLSRFEEGAKMTLVSQVVVEDDTENAVGYRVVTFDGKVMKLRKSELLDICKKITDKEGVPPIQNAKYVEASDKGAHIAKYGDSVVLTETLKRAPAMKKAAETVVAQTEKSSRELAKEALKEKYTKEQLRVLSEGKKRGVDFKQYSNPDLSPEQMEVLLKGLLKGVDVKLIADPEMNIELMYYYITDLEAGNKIEYYLNKDFNIGQLTIISDAYEAGVDISKIANPKLSVSEMSEISQRLQLGIWKTVYEKDIREVEIEK